MVEEEAGVSKGTFVGSLESLDVMGISSVSLSLVCAPIVIVIINNSSLF
jgi:hypothetical protein